MVRSFFNLNFNFALAIEFCYLKKKVIENHRIQHQYDVGIVSVKRILLKHSAVKLGNKKRFDKEQIGIKEPFPVTNLPLTS